MAALGWIRGAGVGFGEGMGLAGVHLWICVIGAVFFTCMECGLCVLVKVWGFAVGLLK
jgi:hypothetical protein